MNANDEFQDVGALIAPITQGVPPEVRPRFLAALERWAAERYRGWAAAVSDARTRRELEACAEREEEIARRVEKLFSKPGGEAEVESAVARILEVAGPLYSDRPLRQVLATQAAAERLGARTWRALARELADPPTREVLEQCARLEEESADVLEAVLASGGPH